MNSKSHCRQRSCYDRRAPRDRRDRWWKIFRVKKTVIGRREGTERRSSDEKRSGWERIGIWASAPKTHPYRDSLVTGLDGTKGFPFW